MRGARIARNGEQFRRAPAAKRLDIFLRLQHDAERLVDRIRIERLPVEGHQRGHPVDCLGHARHLVELRGSQLLRHRRHLLRELRRRFRHALADNRQFLLERRIVDPLIEAATLQRVVHFARAVGREDDERRLGRLHRAELGNRDLKLGQQLEQKPFELLVGAIDLVDQQNGRARARRIDGAAGAAA